MTMMNHATIPSVATTANATQTDPSPSAFSPVVLSASASTQGGTGTPTILRISEDSSNSSSISYQDQHDQDDDEIENETKTEEQPEEYRGHYGEYGDDYDDDLDLEIALVNEDDNQEEGEEVLEGQEQEWNDNHDEELHELDDDDDDDPTEYAKNKTSDVGTNSLTPRKKKVATPEEKGDRRAHRSVSPSKLDQSERPTSPFSVHSEHFKDIEETGKWGNVTKMEIIIAVSLVVLILASIVVVVVVFAFNDSNKSAGNDNIYSGNNNKTSTNNTDSNAYPVAELPKFASPKVEYEALLQVIGSSPFTLGYLQLFPADYDDLPDLWAKKLDDPVNELPMLRAASWILNEDNSNVIDHLQDRFALAVLYFATNGPEWTNRNNWLNSSVSVCEWEHVSCPIPRTIVQEIDLSENGLKGKLPAAVALLQDLGVLWLNDNELTGLIPGELLGSLPTLFILYLQHNLFEGPIPVSLVHENSLLRTLFVQGNKLNGTWPEEFCPVCKMPEGAVEEENPSPICSPKIFDEFGLDCTQTPCPENCCKTNKNCFS